MERFGTEEGLPSNWIYDVLQTRDGFLWIATHNGVARFDGSEFERFNRANTPQLPTNDTRSLHESHDGTLWIGTVGGLVRYTQGRPEEFESLDSLRGHSVHAIYEDSDQLLWLGTGEETWTRSADGSIEPHETAPQGVKAFCQDQEGNLWLGADSGLYVRRGGRFEQVSHPRLPSPSRGDGAAPSTRVNALLADESGIWIGSNRGLLHISDGVGDHLGDRVGQRQVYDLRQVDGVLYAATRHGLWRRSDGDAFENLETGDLSSCIATDQEGGLWVGHYDNRGLSRFARSKTVEWLSDLRINCVYEDPSERIWCGSPSGLHRLEDGKRTDFGIEEGLPGTAVKTIVPESEDTFWIGTDHGFAKWDGAEISTAGVPEELAGVHVSSAYQASNGTLWFTLASRGGYRFEGGKATELEGLGHGGITWFHEDAEGTMWIGHEYGLFRHAGNQTRQVTDPAFDHLNTSHFLCYYASDNGTLWLGTSGGIVRYRSNSFDVITTENGLAADHVDRIVGDNNGNLWLGGRDGFYYIDLASLENFVAGDTTAVTSRTVAYLKGAPSSKSFPKCWKGKDGTTWIIGHRGIISIPPEPWPKNLIPPPVHINRITMDGEAMPTADTFEFVSGQRRLGIDFLAPTFADAGRSQIRYRLDGYDDGWLDAGTDRMASYTDLNPGDYRFRVIAANADGVWNDQEASVSVRVLPRWWERSSVRVLLGLLAIGIGVLIFRHRTRRIRAANTTLRREIRERQRAEDTALRRSDELARVSRAASMGELTTSIAHEVNQPLFAIVSNAQTARRLLDRDPPDLDEVRDALGDITSDGNRASDIITRIRSLVRKEQQEMRLLDLNEVARDVIKLVHRQFRERGTALDTDLQDPLPAVRGDRIELQQVVLNLLINGAQSMVDNGRETRVVLITTSAKSGFVELAVRDRGCGLDDDHAEKVFEPFFTTKNDGTGIGLAINRTIIEAHGGRIWAEPNTDRGATFRFTLPSSEDDSG
ncbi:MAG: two-component regulator propeller domain-containing protein [Verrucomicrobiales bacterium]